VKNESDATNTYHPTLWRTCRVLANERRLACLGTVLKCPGVIVEDVAEANGIPPSTTSVMLRALQARGLIAARRTSRWVAYFPHPDPLVPSAEPILDAVSASFGRGASYREVFREVTAFTHPRRLLILRQLQLESPMDIGMLAGRCGMSLRAAYRHTGKLAARGLVSVDRTVVSLVPPRAPIPSTLLSLVALGL
jgi:DNA-binding transcriptional ArsR family regulator